VDWFLDKTAVVTGAAHGIGEAIARRLADMGAQVVAIDRDEAALRGSFKDLARITPFVGDLAADDVDELAQRIARRYGPVELLVNNVGIDTPHGFLELTQPNLDIVFHTNLRGPWFFTRQLVTDLIAQDRSGAILFISSLHDHVVRRRPHYSCSKAAVAMLVKELAYELAVHGIRVNAISPGVVQSASVPPPTGAQEERTRRIVPLGRIGQGSDVAAMAAVLLSDEWSGYVTGVNVPVDGGLDLYTWSGSD
jgi:NAD(P)-dependent dehydrogenase (short-subunit alcohol dehydrogenase family)